MKRNLVNGINLAAIAWLVSCGSTRDNVTDINNNTPPVIATQGAGDPANNQNQNVNTQDNNKQQAPWEQEADLRIKLAQRYFNEGNLDKAEAEVTAALQLAPNNREGQDLLAWIRALKGLSKMTPGGAQSEEVAKQMMSQIQQIYAEMENAFNRGVRHFNAYEYDEAEKDFLRVVEISRWARVDVAEAEQLRRRAEMMLEQTRTYSKQKELDLKRLAEKEAEEKKRTEEVKRSIELKTKIAQMFGDAVQKFQDRNWERCMHICDEILYLDPKLRAVEDLKFTAQRMRHISVSDDLMSTYIKEWKRFYENVQVLAITPTTEIDYSDPAFFKEVAMNRPVDVLVQAGSTQEEDVALRSTLEQKKIGLDPGQTTLDKFINQIAEVADINFHYTLGDTDPATVNVTILQYKTQSIAFYLKQVLGTASPELTWFPAEGIVHIMTKEEYEKRRLVLQQYRVNDIVFAPSNYPGKEIDLAEEGVKWKEGAPEPATPFDINQLQDFIKGNIQKDKFENGPYEITAYGSNLLQIKATPEAHEQIKKALAAIRDSMGIVVLVEARFLFVEHRFLDQLGMDLRELRPIQNEFVRFPGFPQELINLRDINPGFVIFPQFQTSSGQGELTPGFIWQGGQHVARFGSGRVQNIMLNDFMWTKFSQQVMLPSVGGLTLQYVLIDDVTVEAIIKALQKSQRGYILTAPRLMAYNNQRANMIIANQLAYIKDWNVGGGSLQALPDPVIDIVSDGIIFDIKPVVSADRKYVTVELRATVATLFPRPPTIRQLLLTPPPGGVGLQFPLVIELPRIDVQQVKTTTICPDQGTVIIGGLTGLFQWDAESGIPAWRNIPLLGIVGSERIKGWAKSQLLILMKTKVIVPSEEEKKRFGN